MFLFLGSVAQCNKLLPRDYKITSLNPHGFCAVVLLEKHFTAIFLLFQFPFPAR